MSLRSRVGTVLRKTIGPDATAAIAARVPSRAPAAAPKPAAKKSRYQPSDPFTPAPPTKVTHYAFLRDLHARLQPRTYVEIGVRHGDSLALSRATSIGVDPAYKLTAELQAPVQLVRATSDDFFARDDAYAFLGGVPVDFAFIDGMHLSEFAYRDFVGIEPEMAPGGIIGLDDMLPRNPLEAARDRLTNAWAGDVFKVVEVLRQHRPDLEVVLVNTRPTGTALVFGLDPTRADDSIYDQQVTYFEQGDPQAPPQEYLDRSAAVAPETVLESRVWDLIAAQRANPSPEGHQAILDEVRSWSTLGKA